MTTATCLAIVLACGTPALAQPAAPTHPEPASRPQPTPAPPAAQPAAQPESKPIEGLDDLLGTKGAADSEKAKKPDGVTPLTDAAKADLERMLSPAELKETFEQAVDLMAQTASRVQQSRDVGLPTQRMQEDILRKLDKLIDEAIKQQSSKKQSQQDQQQQQQQQQQRQQGQQQQQQQQQNTGANRQQPGNSPATEDHAGPGRQDGSLRPPLGGSSAWGNLPPHIRESLSQGFSDRFSSVYRQLTEAYYRRLAEEPKP